MLRRWAEIARSARRRLSASLPQLASMSVRVSIQQELRVPSAGARRGRAHRQRGLRRARALLEKAAGSVCAALGPKWKGSTCVARRLSRGGQPAPGCPTVVGSEVRSPDSSPGNCTDAVSPCDDCLLNVMMVETSTPAEVYVPDGSALTATATLAELQRRLTTRRTRASTATTS